MIEPDHHVWSEMASFRLYLNHHHNSSVPSSISSKWTSTWDWNSAMNATTKTGFPQQKPICPWASKPLMLLALPPQCFVALIGPQGNHIHFFVSPPAVAIKILSSVLLLYLIIWWKDPTVPAQIIKCDVPTFFYKRSNRFSKSFDGLHIFQHRNVWAPKQSEEPLQATGSWTSRHPDIVVSTLCKSTLCFLFLIFNLSSSQVALSIYQSHSESSNWSLLTSQNQHYIVYPEQR